MRQKLKSRTFLLVMGIIFIVLGVIGTLSNFGRVVGANVLGVDTNDALFTVIKYELGVAILMLVTGIISVVGANKRGAAPVIIGFGILMLVAKVVDAVWSISVIGIDTLAAEIATFIGTLLGIAGAMILSILIIAGGIRNSGTPVEPPPPPTEEQQW